jgi:hypothetical protein
MTNFEYWKINLKPEVFADRWDTGKISVIFMCAECPARIRCGEIEKILENNRMTCFERFLKWAEEKHE